MKKIKIDLWILYGGIIFLIGLIGSKFDTEFKLFFLTIEGTYFFLTLIYVLEKYNLINKYINFILNKK